VKATQLAFQPLHHEDSDWLISSPLPMGDSRIRNYEKRHEGRGIGTIDTRNEQSVERKALVCESRYSEHSILDHSDYQVQSQDRKEERKKATRIPDTLICQLSISSTRVRITSLRPSKLHALHHRSIQTKNAYSSVTSHHCDPPPRLLEK
jgi:hypothetical protein